MHDHVIFTSLLAGILVHIATFIRSRQRRHALSLSVQLSRGSLVKVCTGNEQLLFGKHIPWLMSYTVRQQECHKMTWHCLKSHNCMP